MSLPSINTGSPAIPQYNPDAPTSIKTAVNGLEKGITTVDPGTATTAMNEALESARQGGAVMQEPDETSPGDAAKAAQTMASFPQAELQADIFSMMKLFQGMEREERNSARMDREVSLQTKVTELNSQADEMETAAEKRFTSAMISGSMQIVGGAMSVGLAAAGGYKQVQGMKTEAAGNAGMNREQARLTQGWEKDGSVGPKPVVDSSLGQAYVTAGKAQTASGMALGQSAGGAGQMVSGMGSLGAAAVDKEAAAADVAAKRNETNATVADTAIQAANDRMQRAKEIIDDMKEKISAMEQSNIETNKGIARNI